MANKICTIYIHGFTWENIEKNDDLILFYEKKYSEIIIDGKHIFLVPYFVNIPIFQDTIFGLFNRTIRISDVFGNTTANYLIDFTTECKIIKYRWHIIPKYITEFVNKINKYKEKGNCTIPIPSWFAEHITKYIKMNKENTKTNVT